MKENNEVFKGNPKYGIKFYNKNNDIKVYADSDFAGDKETSRSTTSYYLRDFSFKN